MTTKQADFPDPPEDCSEGLKLIWNAVGADPERWFTDWTALDACAADGTDSSRTIFTKRDLKALAKLRDAAKEAVLFKRALAATLGGEGLRTMSVKVPPGPRDQWMDAQSAFMEQDVWNREMMRQHEYEHAYKQAKQANASPSSAAGRFARILGGGA